MRTPFTLLMLSSVLALGPAACGSSGSSQGGGDGGSSGGSSGGGSGGSSGGSSGSGSSSGSSSGGGSGSSSGSGSGGSSGSSSGAGDGGGAHIKTVFLILMENHNWSDIYQSSSAPYINSLLTNAQASSCTNYYDNPLSQHPSEPNYIWLEAGTNMLDVTFNTDNDPSAGYVSSSDHLTKQMNAKGVTWKAYAEDATAGSCPISSTGFYAAKHEPMVFFTDIVGSPPSASSQPCIDHVVPYTQLAADIAAGMVPQYNFITPNLCNDMHGAGGCTGSDDIARGDTWLSQQIPIIMASSAYKDGGAIFITWDESEVGEHPIGMIVLSPLGKGGGATSATKYYHSSMLRSVQEIFGLTPLLNDAANQPDLSALFTTFP